MCAEESTGEAVESPAEQAEDMQEICFILMPYGGWHDRYYHEIFRPAVEGASLRPRRADDLYRPSPIMNDVWSFTQQSALVLADLTGRNPNVMYELGLAHAIGKPAILVTESIEDVPFDLLSLRVQEYDARHPRWGEILKEAITRAIRETRESPRRAVLPTFLEVEEAQEDIVITQQEKELLELRQDVDRLMREIRSRNSSRLVTDQSDMTAHPGVLADFLKDVLRSARTPTDVSDELRRRGFDDWEFSIVVNGAARFIRADGLACTIDLSGEYSYSHAFREA